MQYFALTCNVHLLPIAQIDEEFPRRITEPFPNGQSIHMVVEGVGAFLREYDGRTIVVIGHRATKYGLEYWCGDTDSSVEEIVCMSWEWRDVPIWHYELDAHKLERHSVSG